MSPDYGPNVKLSSEDRQDSELLQDPNDSRTDPSLAQTPSEVLVLYFSKHLLIIENHEGIFSWGKNGPVYFYH